MDTLLLGLALALDLRCERLYGCLQDDVIRKLPSLHLALDVQRLIQGNKPAHTTYTLEIIEEGG